MNDLVEFAAEKVHETENAYLFDFGDDEHWLPKSQVDYDEKTLIVKIPEWLAIDKKLV